MSRPRLVLCGGLTAKDSSAPTTNYHIVSLSTHGKNANVNLRFEDVARVFLKDLEPRLLDLLEIAAYVYTADSATRRTGHWADDDATEPWGRRLHFVVPVRDARFWSSPDILDLLTETLGFLSGDEYSFDFVLTRTHFPQQGYLDFGMKRWPFRGVDRVVMFSGGLDSLAGACQLARGGQELVLVSHRPVSTLSKRQRDLFRALRSTFPNPMIHVPVWVNKAGSFDREHTQRTRSFLFSALGAAVAVSVDAHGLRFFENGIVSLNLPLADEVLGTRASRTTHPISLHLFSRLLTRVTERPFPVDNPYLFKTKPDIVATLVRSRGGPLIQHTCSCARTGLFHSKTQWHCGLCSQCIDRRIAVLAGNHEDLDPATDYAVDVFQGPRPDGYDRNVAVDYIRHAVEFAESSDASLAARFDLDISRAVRHSRHRSRDASRLLALHRRHGDTVYRVLQGQLAKASANLLSGRLADRSLLALVAGQRHLEPSWRRYANTLTSLLVLGVPRVCQTTKPSNERHLQDICDGILNARRSELVREFPFMRWASSATKPDWSVEELKLWVEMKYVRERRDVARIATEIATDITKYGDSERRVLFVVYDPYHHVLDQEEFASPIVRHSTMQVTFLR